MEGIISFYINCLNFKLYFTLKLFEYTHTHVALTHLPRYNSGVFFVRFLCLSLPRSRIRFLFAFHFSFIYCIASRFFRARITFCGVSTSTCSYKTALDTFVVHSIGTGIFTDFRLVIWCGVLSSLHTHTPPLFFPVFSTNFYSHPTFSLHFM